MAVPWRRFRWVLGVAVVVALVAGFVRHGDVAPAQVVIDQRVSAGHPSGWYFTNVHTGEDGVPVGPTGGTGGYVVGPAGSLGDGSYHLTTPGMADKARLFNDRWHGVPLAALDDITFQVRKTGLPGYAPSANLVIDPEGPDDYASLAWGANKAGFTVREDVWQTWSTSAGPGWWSSSIPAGSATPGANSHPTDLAGILDRFGRGTTITSLGINLGRSNPGLDAYVDGIRVTIAGSTWAFDFETVDDGDEDGVADVDDRCPAVADPAQTDTDRDGAGNACDDDDDNDGLLDVDDPEPLVPFMAPVTVPSTTTTIQATTTAPTTSPTTAPPVTVPVEPPPLLAPEVISVVTTPSGDGSWQITPAGDVLTSGDAPDLGDVADRALNEPVVALAPTPEGEGYWLVAADGGVFAFGDAPFLGSAATLDLAAPVVGVAPTPSGSGYLLVASDGGVFTFGDASFHGSRAGQPLAAPVVGVSSTPSGDGYWLVGADGGVFTYGDAKFYGSLGAHPPKSKVVALVPTASGHGYWLRDAAGTVHPFGDAVAAKP